MAQLSAHTQLRNLPAQWPVIFPAKGDVGLFLPINRQLLARQVFQVETQHVGQLRNHSKAGVNNYATLNARQRARSHASHVTDLLESESQPEPLVSYFLTETRNRIGFFPHD